MGPFECMGLVEHRLLDADQTCPEKKGCKNSRSMFLLLLPLNPHAAESWMWTQVSRSTTGAALLAISIL